MRGGFRPLQRRSARKLQVHVHVTLVLVRKKAGGQLCAEEAGKDSAHNEDSERNCALANEPGGNSYVAVGRACEDPVKPIEESAQQATTLGTRPQQ